MILHVDMDAFYASVEERERPELKGLPLVVGGSPDGRGVVAAANYAARAFGIHSAMPSARALRLCPDLQMISPRGKLYQSVSSEIHQIFNRYTPTIEPLSLDEAFLDASGSEKLYGSSEQIGWRIKQDIKDELDLVASVGVAPNKFLAKLASDQDKPNGFTVIRPNQIQGFLDPLPVSRLWGIGKASLVRFNALGIHRIIDLRQHSESFLVEEFGKVGQRLWQLSHGQDDRKVVTDGEAKSISHETTFAEDITALHTLQSVALGLTEGVCFRLRKADLKARTINLKVRYHDFSTLTRSRSLSTSTNSTLEIWRNLDGLLNELLGQQKFAVRLIGAGVSNFGDQKSLPEQQDLFASQSSIQENPDYDSRQSRLDKLSDQMASRFGKRTLKRGRSV